MDKMLVVEQDYLKKKIPAFRVGNEVAVHIRVQEGDKTRIQIFSGTVIKKRGQGINASFSVLRDVHGDIVEKVFPLYSPSIEKIIVSKKTKFKRARMYHLRKKKVGTA